MTSIEGVEVLKLSVMLVGVSGRSSVRRREGVEEGMGYREKLTQ